MTQHAVPLARRLAPAVALTGASVVLLLALDHPRDGDSTQLETAQTASDAPSTRVPNTASATTTTTAARRSGGGVSPSPTTTVPATPTCSGTTTKGPSVSTRFGPVQVQATVTEDGTLCDVTALAVPKSDGRSASINQRAVPVLRTRALAAGSADFDAVSGATVTSKAYKQSLQAALDGG